jgi:hypothetical protein
VAYGLAGSVGRGEKRQPPSRSEIFYGRVPHCGRLVSEAHQDPAVVQAMNERFIPVRLEGRNHMTWCGNFRSKVRPPLSLFSPEEQEKQRFAGFQPAGDYFEELANGG